jgi:hypothetical protein
MEIKLTVLNNLQKNLEVLNDWIFSTSEGDL